MLFLRPEEEEDEAKELQKVTEERVENKKTRTTSNGVYKLSKKDSRLYTIM